MNIRALILLASLAATPAWARIIVDDDAPEPAAEPGIQAPAPADTNQPAAGSEQDTLSFLNQDQLHGILLSIDQNTGLHWQSPEAHDPIVFKTGQVSQIRLDSRKAAPAAASAERIGLTNGDEFPGNIISLDDKALVLDTWYAGRLSIPRAMLRTIAPVGGAGSAVYEGPAGLDGWTQGRVSPSPGWTFRDGALEGTNYGTIGRDVNLPDMSTVEFDVVLRGNSSFNVGIYADRPDNSGNCYMLRLGADYTELLRFSRVAGTSPLGNAQLQNVLHNSRTHVELRTNKAQKTIWLLLDGKMVKEWSDPSDFIGGGGNIIFACQPGSFVKISNIKVSKWDGKFDESASPDAKTGKDTVQLANADKVTGRLLSIQDGKARFTSDYADLSIPIERIEEVDLANTNTGEAKPLATDVRAYFPEGGSVTMQLNQWDAKGCTGSSPNFGSATFSPDAFTRILFNLQAQQQNQDSDESGMDSGSSDQDARD